MLRSDYGKAKSHVEGTFGKNGTVTGTFKPRRFKVNDNGELRAIGALTATLTKGNGTVIGTSTKRVNLPVAKAEGAPVARVTTAASCDILNLVLGPRDLNVLGLEVHLDKVVLNIVATTGTGNLLGNLLCAVAGLLDQGGLLPDLADPQLHHRDPEDLR